MSTAAKTAGLKRICTSCGVRFYDLNKRPIICPGCATEFTGDIKVKGKRGRAAPKEEIKLVPVAENEDEIVAADEELDVVSLEDVVEDGEDDVDEAAIVLEDSEIGDIETFEDDDLEEDAEIVPEEDED